MGHIVHPYELGMLVSWAKFSVDQGDGDYD